MISVDKALKTILVNFQPQDKEDAMIWRLYLALRKMDRFLHLRILRKPYVYNYRGKLRDKAKSGISALGNFADIFCVLTHCGFAVKF